MDKEEFEKGLLELTVGSVGKELFAEMFDDDSFTEEQRVIIFKKLAKVLNEYVEEMEK